MSTSPIILGKRDLLNAIGTALLQIKCERRLTLNEMAETLGRSDEMLAQYIAGEAEMGVTAWLRADDAWNLADKLKGNGK
jgi:cyanate lyase